MNRSKLSLAAVVFLAAAPLITVACSKDDGTTKTDTTPGPAERAGAKVDEAAHDTKEGAKEVGRDVKEGAKGAASAVGSVMEKGGEKMQGK